jgi:hypothetical protein
MSVLHCNLARPDFRKYNFGKATPAVQEPVVSLPVLFQRFNAQNEANQLLIELDKGRVGTSLRQIDETLAEQRLERLRYEQSEAERHHSSHQQAATAARVQKQSLAQREADRDAARASEQEAAARRWVQERAERYARRDKSLQALQSRVEACATAARQGREERTSKHTAGLIQDHEVRQGERCSGALPLSQERWLSGRVEDRPNWPNTGSQRLGPSHVNELAELRRVFHPNGRKRL